MKLEVDLEKLSRQVQFRKKSEAEETDAGITIQVRQWGEMLTASTMIPDDILEHQIKMVIEGKILELMMYAPDVSDLKPAEIRVQSNGHVKQASATFYYVSQIADYWHKKIERAKKDAEYETERRTMWELYERWREESEYGKKRNWQAKAAKDMAARLNLEEDDE
jgi:hypothetical protein